MSPTWLHDEDEAAALAAVADVRRRCREHDGHDPLDEAAHLLLKHHGLAGLRPWVTADGFALRHGDADGADGADGAPAALDLAVAPEARGRGLGGTLAAAALAAPGAVTAWSHGDHPAAAAIAGRERLDRVRELWVMRRPAEARLPDAPPPAGVRLRTFEPAADGPALLAVNAAAFADHPEQGALDDRGLAERMAEPWFDPSGLLLAVDDAGDLLGFHWTKRHDQAHGEVYVLGIAPAAQGRGLGRVLTVAGLRHLAERGAREVLLYVESDNGPALRLYDGLGFTHAAADTHVQYLRRGRPARAE